MDSSVIRDDELARFQYVEQPKWWRFLIDEFAWPWKTMDFIELALYALAGAVNCILFSTAQKNSNVENDTKRIPLLQVLTILSPISAFYSMVMFKLRSHWWINLFITVFLVVCPLVVLVVILSTGNFFKYLEVSVAFIYIPCVSSAIGLLKTVKSMISLKTRAFTAELVSVCLILVFNLAFTVIICVLVLDSTATTDPVNLIAYPAVLYLIIIAAIWGAIHTIVFTKQPSDLEILKKEVILLENPSMRVQALLSKSPDLLNQPPEGFFGNYGHLLASFAILITLLSIEIGLILVLSTSDSGKYPDSAMYLAGFYCIAAPIFLFGGILCSASSLKKDDKYCLGLAFFALFPTIGIMALSYLLFTNNSTYYLSIVIGVGFPAMIIYWLSMSLIHNSSQRSYQYFSAICCMVIIVPLGLMWPLYSAGGMKTQTFWVVVGLLFFGGIVILTFFLLQLLLKVSKDLIQLMAAVYKFNGYNLSQYIYSTGFLLGFALLAWMGFKRIDYSTDWIGGFIPGCFVIFGFMIIGTIVVHRVTLYIDETNVDKLDIKEIILGSAVPTTTLQLQNKVKKQKYQAITAVSGLSASLIISIPILATSNNDSEQYAGATIIIGLLISTLIVLLLIELKATLRHFGESVISYTLGCCWIFLLIPFICIVPISLGSAESDQEIHDVTSWSIGSILLIFMLGVSVGSITLNFMFKRLENEKAAKFCCLQVQHELIDNGVKTKLGYLRTMYDNFKISGPDAVEKVLLNATVFYYKECGDKDLDLRFSKEILTVREVEKLNVSKNVSIVEKKKEENGISLWKMLGKLCTNKGEEEKVTVKTQLLPEEMIGIGDPEVVQMEDSLNWDERFKKTIERNTVAQKTIINTTMLKNELEIPNEPLVRNEDISEIRLKPQTKQELMDSNHLKMLLSSDILKKKWLKAAFSRFSSGMIEEGGEPWMNLSDLRQFIRLSGLKSYISNAASDILYIRLTRIYNPATSSISPVKLNFNQFQGSLLEQLGKLKFPKSTYKEASEKVLKEEIYPNLVSNLPYLHEYYPDHSEIMENNEIDEMRLSRFSHSINSDRPIVISSAFEVNLKSAHTIIKAPSCVISSLEKFSKCSQVFFRKVLFCLAKCFGLCLYCLMPSEKDASSPVKTVPIQSESIEAILDRVISPPWEEICNIIVVTLSESDAEYRKNHEKTSPAMQLNFSNLIAILGHFSEIYSFSAVGFASQVGWVYGSSFTDASTVVLADNGYWIETFFTCFAFSVVFIILIIPASRFIKQGRLGLNADLTPARIPSLQFFLTKFIGLFGKILYLTIIASMLSAFSCTYTNGVWHLMRNSSIECFSQEHSVYFVLAIVCLIFYYPAATLLYPNIAYQDKALDLKFDTTYLVIESQGKLVIAGFFAFFAKETYIWLQLIMSIAVSVTLFILNLRMKPCLVQSYNLWKTGGFLIPIWVCSCALVNYYSQQYILAITLLTVGLGVLLGTLLGIHGKLYGFKFLTNLKHIRTLIKEKEVIGNKNNNRDISPNPVSEENKTVVLSN